jgi:hypothetical protein
MKYDQRKNPISRLSGAALVAVLLASGSASAWTSARVARVSVVLELDPSGTARALTEAHYDVAGGRFRGFDLAPMPPGTELVSGSCSAVLDDGRRIPLSFRPLSDGRTRVLLADKNPPGRGGVTFSLEHRMNLIEQGALRRHGSRARLDWTPLIWDGGTDSMTVDIRLPGESRDAPIMVDPDVARDYEVDVSAAAVKLTKHRTVRWYAMRAVVDFDPASLPVLAPEAARSDSSREGSEPALAARLSQDPPPPFRVLLVPALAALFGLLFPVRKTWHLQRALGDLGLPLVHRLLPRTGPLARFALSLAATGLALGVQYAGFLAASVPALAAAAGLWLTCAGEGSLVPRPGGRWRPMEEEDGVRLRRLARAYRSRRRTWIDITHPLGAVGFLAAISALGAVVVSTRADWPFLAWATLMNGLFFLVPAWFAQVGSELPVDPALEGFQALLRWRRSLARLLGSAQPGSEAAFWVREDEKGLIEARLRVEPPPAGLHSLEMAGEVVRAGTTTRVRKAAVLRLEPGTDLARRLAACAHAAEHHLTPDLREEIIVLRDRRGRADSGLAPLRAALALLPR